MRQSFPMPRFNERRFNMLEAENEIDLSEINEQRLLEDFRLRYRHLVKGDLSDEEKKHIVKKILSVNESSDYHNALTFLTAFLCKGDRYKTCAILACFSRLGEANVRRRINKLIACVPSF